MTACGPKSAAIVTAFSYVLVRIETVSPTSMRYSSRIVSCSTRANGRPSSQMVSLLISIFTLPHSWFVAVDFTLTGLTTKCKRPGQDLPGRVAMSHTGWNSLGSLLLAALLAVLVVRRRDLQATDEETEQREPLLGQRVR